MAKPILQTPPVSGADADALIESLKHRASPEEMARRIACAKERLKSNAEGSAVYHTHPTATAASLEGMLEGIKANVESLDGAIKRHGQDIEEIDKQIVLLEQKRNSLKEIKKLYVEQIKPHMEAQQVKYTVAFIQASLDEGLISVNDLSQVFHSPFFEGIQRDPTILYTKEIDE